MTASRYEQCAKAYLPMLVTEFGMNTEVRDEHSENALASMDVTLYSTEL